VTAGDRSYIKVLIGWKISDKPASDEFLASKSQTKLQVQERNCSKAANKQFSDVGHPKVTLRQKYYFS
jgi:hypothetical protein